MGDPLRITLETIPDLLQLHQASPETFPYLLASTAEGNLQSRYHILFACPQENIQLNHIDEFDFLARLDKHWQQQKTDTVSSVPFSGGWFIYLGYELAQQIEPCLDLPPANDGLPIAFATRCPAAVIVDRIDNSAWVVCEANYPECATKIQSQLNALQPISEDPAAVHCHDILEDNPDTYRRQFARIHQYIIDGDVFQVNLSRQWQCQLVRDVSHTQLFRQLSRHNPGPFNALVSLGNKAIISSSPERLVEVRQGDIQTRPIAGTRPRASQAYEDQAMLNELIQHPKERAEHIMLIDLERNDLGRVCEPGSVHVSELLSLETYEHVHHIVSNVKGKLRPDVTPAAVIRSVFPGGTITGCPKVRCMEILAEQELSGRGAYTGSLGYLNRDGSMDLNILIRTMTRNVQHIQFRAGGGIVIDSEVEHELTETRAKARALVLALSE